MAEFSNIHHAIARLSPLQVASYLRGRGWTVDESSRPGVLYFENENAAGEPLRFWMWESPEQPKFRSQLQNLLFGLSVFEQREPLEVANEMCKVPLAANPASQPATASRLEASVQIRNQQDHSLTVVFQGVRRPAIPFYPGDCFEIRSPAHIPVIDLTGDEVVVHGTPNSPIQILFRAGNRLNRTKSIARCVDEVLALEACEPAGSAREELEPTLARLEFEVDGASRADEGGQRARYRQTAVLASALAKQLAPSPSAYRVVWILCAELLDGAGLGLVVSDTAMEQLFSTAQQDDEITPRMTLDWLTRNTGNVSALETP